MNFEWYLFGMTIRDSQLLSSTLSKCHWQRLTLSRCGIDDARLKNLCEALQDHQYLKFLSKYKNLRVFI